MAIKQKRATAAVWETLNPVLDAGEFGYDMTAKRVKIGDGYTPWNSLDWQGGGGEGASIEVYYEFLDETEE